MLDNLLSLWFFRDLFSKEKKWYLAIFYLITGVIGLILYFILLCLKLFTGILGLLTSGSRK